MCSGVQSCGNAGHPLQVEEEKKGKERGTYLDPELFGQSEDTGLAWVERAQFVRGLEEIRGGDDPAALLAKNSRR